MNEHTSTPPPTAVAMSGGVDSSTVAALLREQGLALIGLTMQLWNQRRLPEIQSAGTSGHRCCSIDDVYDARRVAEHLDIPFYVVNFERQFEDTVIRPFVAEYLAGRTPIPCTLCNNHVKFDQLLLTARQIGADCIATGHYARIRHNPATTRFELLTALDRDKDQSYFLFGLTQEQLARTSFPLGELTKDEVRAIARRLRVPVAEKPESQEICFVPGGDHSAFIEAYRREQNESNAATNCSDDPVGEIVATDGTVLGEHHGLHRFTVGQRRGLGIAAGRPMYVVSLDTLKNQLVVGDDADLRTTTARVANVNWICIESLDAPLDVTVKIRHRHDPAPATLFPDADGAVEIRFHEPQRAVTPGQAAVFYSADPSASADSDSRPRADESSRRVIGGGWLL